MHTIMVTWCTRQHGIQHNGTYPDYIQHRGEIVTHMTTFVIQSGTAFTFILNVVMKCDISVCVIVLNVVLQCDIGLFNDNSVQHLCLVAKLAIQPIPAQSKPLLHLGRLLPYPQTLD